MNVGKRIAELREKAGYTQNRLAELSGVSQSHLRRVELEQSRITVDHLELICDALGVTLKEFFDDGNESDEFSMAVATLTPKQKMRLLEFIKSL